MTKKIAGLFGIIFIIFGILGFIENPIVGEVGWFHADMIHNIIRIVIGLILVSAAAKGASALWLKMIGIVYLLVAIIGFMTLDASGRAEIFGLIHVHQADNLLHLVVAIIFLGTGFMGKKAPMQMSTPNNMGGMPGQM